MKKQSFTVLFQVFLPFAAGYFLSYLYRVVNAVIAPNLVADLGLGPSALGLLTATYFITFAAFQLPLGVLLDRFGPRRTESVLLIFAGLGAFIFSQSESFTGLIFGRALIGFGVSACLMAAFKAYTMWFPREKWPMVNGFQMACGGLGALAATSPVEAALGVTDWRHVFLVLSLLTVLNGVVIFFIVPEKERPERTETLTAQLGGIKSVFTSAVFWRVAPITTMSQAAFLSIQGLWAGPWLHDVAGFNRTEVAALLFWIAVSMIAGFLFLGKTAERLNRRGISIQTTAVSGITVFIVVQFLVLTTPLSVSMPVWLAFGFFGTSGIIAYPALSQAFPVSLSGRVTTAVNLLVFVSAFAAQWAIGSIIEFWPMEEGGRYAVAGFKTAFYVVLSLQVLALGWFFLSAQLYHEVKEARRL
jgi:MFS family permease